MCLERGGRDIGRWEESGQGRGGKGSVWTPLGTYMLAMRKALVSVWSVWSVWGLCVGRGLRDVGWWEARGQGRRRLVAYVCRSAFYDLN